jgi:hypothetical protein
VRVIGDDEFTDRAAPVGFGIDIPAGEHPFYIETRIQPVKEIIRRIFISGVGVAEHEPGSSGIGMPVEFRQTDLFLLPKGVL